jgi:DNA-binding transcriptional LysR family regulator
VAHTAPALASVRRVFDVSTEFDPSVGDREFTIVTSDYAAAVLGPVVARLLAERAPGIRLRLQQTVQYAVDHAIDTPRSVDGLVIPWIIPGLMEAGLSGGRSSPGGWL